MGPTQQQHLTKAVGNAAFAQSLPLHDQTQIDWAHTAIFYSALHYIEAYLVKIGQPCEGHPERNRKMISDPVLSQISMEYRHLKYFSHSARYLFRHLTAHQVKTEALPDLETIATYIKGVL